MIVQIMFLRCEQAMLRSEITRLHGVIDAVEEKTAQKDDAINWLKAENARLKAENARLNAAVAAKHVCTGRNTWIGKSDGKPKMGTTTKTSITDGIGNLDIIR